MEKTVRKSKQTKARKKLKIHVLGGGREVGCNAFLVEGSDRNVMLDFGVDVSHNRPPLMPSIRVDDLFLCHGHLDHIGSAAELYRKTKCNVKSYSIVKII